MTTPYKTTIIPFVMVNGITSPTELSGIVAFGAGILSFFSPCVLPLVPSYLVFISGITLEDYNKIGSTRYRKIVFVHALLFILGFSFVFVSLGVSSSFIGSLLSEYQTYIMKIGGILLIILGLFCLNVVKIPFLNREKAFHLKEKPLGLFGSFLVGVTFSLGWTPCIGPALSSILILASSSKNIATGVYLLALYALGMAIPFLLSALVFDRLIGLLNRFGYIVKHSVKVLGVLLILVGFLLFTSYMNEISLWFGQILPPD
ncbi:MAG: cytochrome c biogenesis CcdA family protein [Syntrophorhabdaceae bacterium]|nr:cytochrome c biogenesis CcdA family protein [Syntrophorhabdaceae bacterium]